jgi:glutathione S-transferase fosA5
MISGLNHITLAVRDVERSFKFYVETLGAKPLARWSRGAYLLAGDLWLCLALDERTRSSALPEYSHIAFSVREAEFNDTAERIRTSGATIWKENDSEGASLYFLDPDGHKLEIHAGDWRTRLAAMKADPWEPNIEYFDRRETR